MTKKTLTFRNMVETYGNAKANMDEVWEAFHLMYLCDFIDKDTWKKFYNHCAGWWFDNCEYCLRDSEQNDEVIARF